jgi:hypothetical protein
MADETQDRGPEFDSVPIGRSATGALDAGYEKLTDLPEHLDSLLELHGVGPAAVRRLQAARSRD